MVKLPMIDEIDNSTTCMPSPLHIFGLGPHKVLSCLNIFVLGIAISLATVLTLLSKCCRLREAIASRLRNKEHLSVRTLPRLFLDENIRAILWEMFVPYEIERFFDRYWSMILDFLLTLPFIRYLRIWRMQRSNQVVSEVNRPSLLQLPDELILEVCNAVYQSGCSNWCRVSGSCKRQPEKRQSLLNLSSTNKRMRNITAPIVLTNINLGHIDLWWRSSRALWTAQYSEHAKHCARALSLNMQCESSKIGCPPRNFAPRLVKLMAKLEYLTKFTLVVPSKASVGLQKAFTKPNEVELPTIKKLVLGSHVSWIVSHCPHVEAISTWSYNWLYGNGDGTWPHDEPLKLIEAAGKAKTLTHFEMHEHWSVDLITHVTKHIPRLRILGMLGPRYADDFEALLPRLMRFNELETLMLAEPHYLRVGYDPPGCGNCYFGPEGRRFRRQMEEARVQALDYVGVKVFLWLPRLKELWTGDCDRAVVKEGAIGDGNPVWERVYRRTPYGRY